MKQATMSPTEYADLLRLLSPWRPPNGLKFRMVADPERGRCVYRIRKGGDWVSVVFDCPMTKREIRLALSEATRRLLGAVSVRPRPLLPEWASAGRDA